MPFATVFVTFSPIATGIAMLIMTLRDPVLPVTRSVGIGGKPPGLVTVRKGGRTVPPGCAGCRRQGDRSADSACRGAAPCDGCRMGAAPPQAERSARRRPDQPPVLRIFA